MRFDPALYGPAVARILALDCDGARPMPLVHVGRSSPEARSALKNATPGDMFPGGRCPEAAFAGLYLYFSCWEEAHQRAQEIPSAEGSYWHAIAHRQEPDIGNSGYWFRRVGTHPIFDALRDEAAALGMKPGPRWDPYQFLAFCERAAGAPGSADERLAMAVQLAEWQLLFDYCAAGSRA
jgi:hypothetical protein